MALVHEQATSKQTGLFARGSTIYAELLTGHVTALKDIERSPEQEPDIADHDERADPWRLRR